VYYANRILAVAVLLVLSIAALYSIRLAIADAAFRKHTPQSVARALEMEPDRANYLLFRALQLDYDGADSTGLLERAARVNPLASEPRIRLGLAAEARGEFAVAEKWLLDAARVDHQFEPRWTLANFYFRQERPDEFWKWIRSALEVSYGDRRLAFDLCWRMTQTADEVLARAIPDKHDVLAAYLYYVMDRRHDAVGPAALKLGNLHDRSDLPQLEFACDLLIDNGSVREARELWRQIGHAETGLVNNGDFVTEPTGHGFDWRPAPAAGVTDVPLAGGYRILFSGRQPESAELLRQFVALEPGKSYTLRWEVRTQGLGSPTGIEWTAAGAHALIQPAQDWHPGAVKFRAASALLPITLRYQRPTGQARAEGSVEIRAVSLTAQ